MERTPQKMWEEYRRGRSKELQRELMLAHQKLVKQVVAKYKAVAYNVAGTLETKDLEQIGMLGLLDAIERFDPERGIKFETYAITRIRGTIQDELRRLDWVPRSVRKQARETDRVNAMAGGQGDSGSAIMERPVGRMSVQWDTGEPVETGNGSISSMENVAVDDQPDPLEEVGRKQMKAVLLRMVERLPDDERLIITLYYYEEITFKDIGVILRLSESRISQKHALVMKKLRSQLKANQ